MAVNLSPVFGVAGQLFDNNGNPLAGGKIYTYLAGTTTNAAVYISSNGSIAHSNPIILDGAGRVPSGEIWLTDGITYKFVVQDSANNLIGTYDNLTGINSNFVAFTNQQEIQTATAGQTVFNLATMQYQPGTNSLSVFVDGVNQYGPGAQYAYVETDSDTVTFVSGLHVGAEVKFTTTQQQGAGYADAAQISYLPPFTGSVATNVENRLAQTVSVKDFGAVGDGVTNDTDAFAAAAAYITAQGGGTLEIPFGTYIVGKQTFNGTFYENGQTWRYAPSPILWFDSCTNPVVVNGNGSTLKVADGMKFGSFDSSGNPTGGINSNTANIAAIGDIISFYYCGSVAVNNLEIDGNMANAVLGGFWGDTGRQCRGTAVFCFQNKRTFISNVYAHHNCLDGFIIQDLTPNTEDTQAYMENCLSEYNARQGISVLDTRQFTAVNSQFNFSGQATFGSAPQSSCDIEPSGSPATNISFVNCKFLDSKSTGVVCDNQTGQNFVNFYHCEIVGCDGFSIYVRSNYFQFNDCRIRGKMAGYTSTSANSAYIWGPKFFNCRFDNEDFNGKTVYGCLGYDSDGGWHSAPLFDNCTFWLVKDVPGSYPMGTYDGQNFTNCRFFMAATDVPAGTTIVRFGGETYGNFNAYLTQLNNIQVFDSTSGIDVSSNPWLVDIRQAYTVATNGLSVVLQNNNTKNLRLSSGGSSASLSTSNFGATLPTAIYKMAFKKRNDPFWADEATVLFNNAAPTTGTWNQGDIVFNDSPSAGGSIGWVCVTAGTPGTWKTFGAISA